MTFSEHQAAIARKRWAKTTKESRSALGRQRVEARWGTKVTLALHDGSRVPGYMQRKTGSLLTWYRIKGENEWRNTPNGDLIGGIFHVHGLR